MTIQPSQALSVFTILGLLLLPPGSTANAQESRSDAANILDDTSDSTDPAPNAPDPDPSATSDEPSSEQSEEADPTPTPGDAPHTVTTVAHGIGTGDLYRPTTEIAYEELQRALASSVPATLEGVPGFDVQFNGPGAASPSIRGLPGDRVLMLEDGHRTGDIYWSAPDHGVMSEPLSAASMEVVRGPAGLLFGPNALGGVVNVIRNEIPTVRPDRVETTLGSQFESVNRGISGGAVLRGPLGPLAFYAEGTARNAGDTRTPLGILPSTGLRTFNGATGLSWTPDWGLLGGAFRYYDTTFGVPGEFNGEMIPGGHPGGVNVHARRIGGRLKIEAHEPLQGFSHLELKSNFVSFRHQEFEARSDADDVLGAQFDQLSSDHRFTIRHEPRPVGHGSLSGAFGTAYQLRQLDARGASPGTRSGIEHDLGLFGFEDYRIGVLSLQIGARYDFRHVTPEDQSDINLRTEERRIVKSVSPRQFHSLSGSLSALYAFHENWTLGANLSRAVRNPTIEELYSDGPHLADFSFDIGSPDLPSEIGHGLDLFLRGETDRLEIEVAIYANQISNYIHYNPTGDTYWVFRENTAPRITPVFEAQSDHARFFGAEGRIQWELLDSLILDGTLSYTHATRIADQDPLPFIPPLSGRLHLRYDGPSFFGAIGARLAAPQHRVPRPIPIGDTANLERPQEPTDGYLTANLMVGWNFDTTNYGHTIIFQVQNLANQDYRSHLSRIKELAPQPGRNVQLSYKAFF